MFNYHGIFGPDVSFYQDLYDSNGNRIKGIDFQKMKDAGAYFVIIRAGQHNWKDSSFTVNWQEAKRVGLPRAPYFFLDKDGEGKAQAEFFWSLIKDDPGEGPLIVDFEDGSGSWPGLYDFLVRLSELSGYANERIWIYTGRFYWEDFGPRTAEQKEWFIRHPLWLAKWSTVLTPEDIPSPWIDAIMWQKGTTVVWGPDFGVHSLELDYNEFNGDQALFKKFFLTDYVPDPDPGEENKNMKYKVVWAKGASKRRGPSTNHATIANRIEDYLIVQGDEVEVVQDNISDAADPSNANKRWALLADGSYAAHDYPDSMGTPRQRMVKVGVSDPGGIGPMYRFKLDGFKEISGRLEKE